MFCLLPIVVKRAVESSECSQCMRVKSWSTLHWRIQLVGKKKKSQPPELRRVRIPECVNAERSLLKRRLEHENNRDPAKGSPNDMNKNVRPLKDSLKEERGTGFLLVYWNYVF
jgi:hypothetical protein